MWNRIVHPRLWAGDFSDLTDFYAHTCTIQRSVLTQDAAGGEVHTWGNLAGHANLPCVVAPGGGREAKTGEQTYVVASHAISLAGHHPTIQETDRAVIDGALTLDILLVEIDSQSRTTHLSCQIVE